MESLQSRKDGNRLVFESVVESGSSKRKPQLQFLHHTLEELQCFSYIFYVTNYVLKLKMAPTRHCNFIRSVPFVANN